MPGYAMQYKHRDQNAQKDHPIENSYRLICYGKYIVVPPIEYPGNDGLIVGKQYVFSVGIIHPAKMDARVVFDEPCRSEVIFQGIQTASQEEIIGVPKGIYKDPVKDIDPQNKEDNCR